MYIPKRYGQGKIDKCPFCEKNSTVMNSQNVPVCSAHKEEELNDLKCLCGDSLDVLNGKFGVFFSCIKCGNMNLRKALEINMVKVKKDNKESFDNSKEKNKNVETQKNKPGEIITVRSDDPRYFD